MDLKCPGKVANAIKDSIIITCPSCRREVELFGDEQRIHCRCGQWIFREALPSCAKWCPSAQQCLGSVGNLKKMLEAVQAAPDQEAQEERLRDLRERIAQAQKNCGLDESKKTQE